MGRSSSGRSRAESEVFARPERRRTYDEDETQSSTRTRSQADPVTPGSSQKKRLSRRDDRDRDEEYTPTTSRRSVSSQNPYASPNSVTSYVPADPESRHPRESAADLAYKEAGRERKRDSAKSTGQSDRTRATDDNPVGDSRRRSSAYKERVGDESRRRDSKRQSTSATVTGGESARGLDNHNAALPQNQFPGQAPDTYTQPYRPPGLAADYYGDNGESVSFQPGVRPQQPSIIHTADQYHLYTPTIEAAPPPEPSSQGQAGAASSYFSMDADNNTNAVQTTPSRPLRPGRQLSQPVSAPRMSPALSGPTSGPSMSPGALGGPAAGIGAGAAAAYFAGADMQASSYSQQQATTSSSHQSSAQYNGYTQNSYEPASRPPQKDSNRPHYGTVAAASLAGAAAAGYYVHNQHDQQQGQQSYAQGSAPGFVLGQNQSALPNMQQQQRVKHKHRGPFTKFADWFRDPNGVAEFEQYTEAIGVCKYCFDPNSSPAQAPRRHHYHKHSPAGPSRYGSSHRVDKIYRNSSSSSSDEEKRRRSSKTKIFSGAVAGYGAAKVGEALYKQRYDFDDTYSVKSGQPIRPDHAQSNTQSHHSETVEDLSRRDNRRVTGNRISSTGNVPLQRRDSGSYRKTRRNEEDSSLTKHASKRRGSSSSRTGISRGAAISIGAGIAGVAGIAAERRRSRSRSGSRDRASGVRRKKSYYSKRISPRHSYVDLSTKNTGPLGFGNFFSSPSANEKKGKRSKGLFTFRNDSSSSSDADLAFGAAILRSKNTRREKQQRDSGGVGDTAAILGLAATGAALAAESDKRSDKRRSRRDTADEYTATGSRRMLNARINLQDHETTSNNDDEGVWEDAPDDETSSVDTALAYGGRLSARTSRESLADKGTSKWDWRWNKNKDRKAPSRQQSDSRYRPQEQNSYDLVSTGMAGAGVATAGYHKTNGPPVSVPTPLPPMQVIDPVPTSSPHYFETRAKFSTLDNGSSPQAFASRDSIPLEQPQVMTVPTMAVMPQVLGKLEADAELADSPDEMPQVIEARRTREDSEERKRPRRRDSSPPLINPSTSSRQSVSWDLTAEQIENERKAAAKQERRRSRREEKGRRRSSESKDSDPDTAIETTPQPRKDSLDKRAARQAEIDKELQALYAEHERQMQEQKELDEYRRSHGEIGGVAAAVIGAGVGAATAAMIDDKKRTSESDSDRKARRKSGLKRSSLDRVESPPKAQSPPQETQQERIARMVAHRVNTPSPVHDNYSDFFVPPELAEHLKEHNVASKQRNDHAANIVTISPDDFDLSSPRRPFEPQHYEPYDPSNRHLPDYHPRGVPILELIEATPPGSRSTSRRREASPLRYEGIPDQKEETTAPAESEADTNSKINWGSNSTHVFEVQTPEDERKDPIADTDRLSGSREPDRGDQPSTQATEQRSMEGIDKVYTAEDDADRSINNDRKVTQNDMPPDVAEEVPWSAPGKKSKKEKKKRRSLVDDGVSPRSSSSSVRTASHVDDQAKGSTPQSDDDIRSGKDIENFAVSPFTETIQENATSKAEEPEASSDEQVSIPTREADLLGGKSVYHSPFAESSSDMGDMGDSSHRDVPKTGHGYVESIPESPVDERTSIPHDNEHATPEGPQYETPVFDDVPAEKPRSTRSERRRLERAMSSSEAVTPIMKTQDTEHEPIPEQTEPQDIVEESPDISQPSMPGDFGVFNYMVDDEGNHVSPEANRELEAAAASALSYKSNGESPISKKGILVANDYASKDVPKQNSEVRKDKPARAFTFDDSTVEQYRSGSKSEYASDPEDWETSHDSKTRGNKKSMSRSDIGGTAKDLAKGAVASAATIAAISTFGTSYFNKPKAAAEPDFYAQKNDTSSAVNVEPDFYATPKEKKKKKSKRDSEIFDDYDAKSVASLPGTNEEDRKSKRRSKRDSEVFDDDEAKSVTSAPATKEEDRKSRQKSKGDSDLFKDDNDTRSIAEGSNERKSKRKSKRDSEIFDEDDTRSVTSTSTEKRKSKDKEKEKEKKSTGLFASLFSSNKSDVSTSSKKSLKSVKSEPRADRERDGGDDREKRKKHRSKSSDRFDDSVSIASEPVGSSRQRSASRDAGNEKPLTREPRDASLHDGFVSADEGSRNGHQDRAGDKNESFLAEGLEMPQPMATAIPMGTNGVSGLPIEKQPPPEPILETNNVKPAQMESYPEQLPALPAQDDDEHMSLNSSEDVVLLPNVTPTTERTRRLSAVRTGDFGSSPAVLPSPTAVPLHFGRRYPITPSNGQRGVIPPAQTSPLSTPRTRQQRPKSTDGKEFKPLYLVERHGATKITGPESDEDLPSLPSSRMSSAHPSMEDLRGQALAQLEGQDYHIPLGGSPELHRERGRRQSTSYDEYLDSRSATPVPGEKQRARETEAEVHARKDKQLKYEFHSPSELMQNPHTSHDPELDDFQDPRSGSPLPSVVSTDNDQEFMSAESTFATPERSRDVSEERVPRPRSPSRERTRRSSTILAGLGIAGTGAAALLATADHFPGKKDGDVSPERDHDEYKVADETMLLESLVPETAPLTVSDEPEILQANVEDDETDIAAPQPEDDVSYHATSSKKLKKDKKKKRKTTDSIEMGLPIEVEIGASRVTDEPASVLPLLEQPSHSEDIPQPDPRSEANDEAERSIQHQDPLEVQEVSRPSQESAVADTLVATTESDMSSRVPADDQLMADSPQPAGEEEWALPSKKSKKDKKKKKGKASALDDLPNINTAAAQEASLPQDEEQPATAIPAFEASGDLTSRDFESTDAAANVMAETLPAEQSEDWNQTELADTEFEGEEHVQSESSPVKDIVADRDSVNNSGVLEEAFERAVKARGLSDSITRKNALQLLMPKQDDMPTVPNVGSTTVSEGASNGVASPLTEPGTIEHEIDAEQELVLESSKKGKREKKKGKKRGIAFEPEAADESSQDIEPVTSQAVSDRKQTENRFVDKHGEEILSKEPAALSFAEDNPIDKNFFGTDFEIKREAPAMLEGSLGSATDEPSRSFETPTTGLPQDDAEETAWAPISKKDKKKKKSQRSSQVLEPEVDTNTTEQTSREIPDISSQAEPLEMLLPAEDGWAESSGKTSQKSKKDKKRKSTTDWTASDIAPAAIVATGIAAGAGIANILHDGEEEKSEVFDEPADIATADEANKTMAADLLADDIVDRGLNSPVTEQVLQPTTPGDDDFDSFSSKKSKKDKKKKKSKSSAFDDWQEGASSEGQAQHVDDVSTASAQEADISKAVDQSNTDEIFGQTPIERPSEATKELDSETRNNVETTSAPAENEDEWALLTSSKKSKKDKKKKSRSMTSSLEELPVETPKRTSVDEQSVMNEADKGVTPSNPMISDIIHSSSEPAPAQVEAVQEISRQVDEVQPEPEADIPKEQPNDDWAELTSKSSKKDKKKKKRQSTPNLELDSTNTAMPAFDEQEDKGADAPMSEDNREVQDQVADQDTLQPLLKSLEPTESEDMFEEAQQAFEDTREVQAPDVPLPAEAESPTPDKTAIDSLENPSDKDETPRKPVQVGPPQTPSPFARDVSLQDAIKLSMGQTAAVLAKSSPKKTKAVGSSSGWEPWVPSRPEPTMIPVPDESSAIESSEGLARQVEASQDPIEKSEIVNEPAREVIEEPPADIPAVTTKVMDIIPEVDQIAADSAIAEEDVGSRESASAASKAQDEEAPGQQRQLEEVQPEEDLSALPSKSKKGKKDNKKRKSETATSFDEPTIPAQASVEDRELSPDRADDPIPPQESSFTRHEGLTPADPMVNFGEVNHTEDVSAHHKDFAEGLVGDNPIKVLEELDTFAQPKTEAEVEESWAPSNSKKSKKDKKKRKSTTFDLSESATPIEPDDSKEPELPEPTVALTPEHATDTILPAPELILAEHELDVLGPADKTVSLEPAEDDLWDTPKTVSKKDKKKKRKSGFSTPAAEEESGVQAQVGRESQALSEAAAEPVLEIFQDRPVNLLSNVENEEDVASTAIEQTSGDGAQELPASFDETSNGADGGMDWAITRKPSKKDKKKKKKSDLSMPEDDSADVLESEILVEQQITEPSTTRSIEQAHESIPNTSEETHGKQMFQEKQEDPEEHTPADPPAERPVQEQSTTLEHHDEFHDIQPNVTESHQKPEPIEHPVAPAEDPIEEDEWAITRKPSKKDKKKKKKTGQDVRVEEHEPNLEPRITEQLPNESNQEDLTKTIHEPEEQANHLSFTPSEPIKDQSDCGLDLADEPQANTADLETLDQPKADDEWNVTRKSSKKEKKKKGKSASSTQLEAMEALTIPMQEQEDSQTDLTVGDRGTEHATELTQSNDPTTEAFDIIRAEQATASFTELVEPDKDDEWAVPKKASKKDKKKQKKSGVSIPAEEPADTATAANETEPVTESLVTEDHPVETTREAFQTDEPATETDPVTRDVQVSVVPDRSSIPQEDDEWSIPIKSSKKDKKKKMKSGISTPTELLEVEETTTMKAQDEDILNPAEVSLPETSKEVSQADDTVIQAKEPHTIEEDEPVQPQEDDEWALPIKSSKKDKRTKGKSGISTPVDKLQPETDAPSGILNIPSLLIGKVSNIISSIIPTSETSKELETSDEQKPGAPDNAKDNDSRTADPVESTEFMQPMEDEEWSIPWKPSKKDKKKKKGISTSTIEPAVENVSHVQEADDPILATSEDLPQDADSMSKPAEVIENDAHTVTETNDLVEAKDVEWAMPVKSSKKDKKKKRKSGISTPIHGDLAEPVEAVAETLDPSNVDSDLVRIDEPVEAPAVLAEATHDPIVESQQPEPSHGDLVEEARQSDAERDLTSSWKPLKKDKKKKRKSGALASAEEMLDEPDVDKSVSDTQPPNSNEPDTVDEMVEASAVLAATTDEPFVKQPTREENTSIEVVNEAPAREPEDEWSVSRKPSKKDKKKKTKGQVLLDFAETETLDEPQAVALPEPTEVTDAAEIAEKISTQDFVSQESIKNDVDSQAAASLEAKSAQEFHSESVHQTWLTRAQEAASAFPSKPVPTIGELANKEETLRYTEQEAVQHQSASELHSEPSHQSWLTGMDDNTAVFPFKPDNLTRPQIDDTDEMPKQRHDELEEHTRGLASTETDIQVEADPNSEFSVPSTKKSKKDKKKSKRKSVGLEDDDFANIALGAVALGTTGMTIVVSGEDTDSASVPTAEVVEARDIQEPSATNMKSDDNDYWATSVGEEGDDKPFNSEGQTMDDDATDDLAADDQETWAETEAPEAAKEEGLDSIVSDFLDEPSREQDQDTSWMKGNKREKKSKKGKKGSVSSVSSSNAEFETPYTEEPAVATSSSRGLSDLVADEEFGGDTPFYDALASARETPAENVLRESEGFPWASALKKGKKDKKKRKSVTWSDADTSTPATPANERPDDLFPAPIEAEEVVKKMEPATLAEQEAIMDLALVSEPQETAWNTEPETSVQSSVPETVSEPTRLAQAEDDDPRTIPLPENLTAAEEHQETAELLQPDPPTPATEKEEFSWAPPTSKKKSKKDKKKRGSTIDLDEDDVTAEKVDTSREVFEADVTPASEAIESQPVPEAVAEDDWNTSTPAKKGKKDKKKKRTASTFGFEEELAPKETEFDDDFMREVGVESSLDVPTVETAGDTHTTETAPFTVSKDLEMSPAEQAARLAHADDQSSTAQEKPEDFGDHSAETIDTTAEEIYPDAATSPVAENVPEPSTTALEDVTIQSEAADDELTVSPTAPEDVTIQSEAADDEWAAPSKKSKKDKKKKRQAVAEDSATTAGAVFAAATAVVTAGAVALGLREKDSEDKERDISMTVDPETLDDQPPESVDKAGVTDTEPANEDIWGPSTQKSKKDKKDKKKKRLPTLDDELSREPEGNTGTDFAANESMEVAGQQEELEDVRVRPVDESMAHPMAEVAPEQENVWPSSSGKKPKKDKKKKLQSMYDDEISREPEENRGQGPTTDAPADSVGQHDKLQDANEGPVGGSIAQPTSEAANGEDDLWTGSSGKKSKKDKKKKKQSVLEEEKPEVPTDAELEVVGPSQNDSTFEPEVQSATQTADIMDASNDRQDIVVEERGVPGVHAEDVFLADDGPGRPAEPEAREEDMWALPSKKSKKDKKKKKQSGSAKDSNEEVTDSQTPTEIEEARISGEQPHHEPPPDQDPRSVEHVHPAHDIAHESRNTMSDVVADLLETEKGREDIVSPPVNRAETSLEPREVDESIMPFEEAVLEQIPASSFQDFERHDSSREIVPDAPSAPVDDVWASTNKKAKKDRKSKKRQPNSQQDDEQESMPLEALSADQTDKDVIMTDVPSDDLVLRDIPDEQAGPQATELPERGSEQVPEDEWATPGKKPKKDKKKKRKSTTAEDDEFGNGPHVNGESLQLQEPEKDRQVEESPAVERLSARELHDAPEHQNWLAGAFSAASNFPARQEEPKQVRTPELSARELHDAPTHQDWLTGAHAIVSHFPTKPAPILVSVPDTLSIRDLAEEAIPSQEELELTRKKGKKGKKDKKARRIVERTDPAGWSGEDKDVVIREPITDVAQQSDVGSDVSASTRERRKRRRSPPLRLGDDPEDLPRDRAMTPPPDHDDIMDTALNVAAAMGFGADHAEVSREMPKQAVLPPAGHQDSSGWSFANLDTGREAGSGRDVRDSGIQFESSAVHQSGFPTVRDSGFVSSPYPALPWDQNLATGEREGSTHRPTRSQSPTSSNEDLRRSHRSVGEVTTASEEHTTTRDLQLTPAKRQPTPVDPTSKDRSSALFQASPAGTTSSKTLRSKEEAISNQHSRESSETLQQSSSISEPQHASMEEHRHLTDASREHPSADLHRVPTIHGSHHRSREQLHHNAGSPSARRLSNELASNLIDRPAVSEINRGAFTPSPRHSTDRVISPTPRTPLHPIPEGSSPLSLAGYASAATLAGIAASSRDDPTSSNRSLGKSKSRTSSLRDLRGSATSPLAELSAAQASAPSIYSADGATRERDMAELYDGYGAFPGSPMSPTRPPSVRKRQSMQQIRDLEAKVDQLANENRSLVEARMMAERHLEDYNLERSRGGPDTEDEMRTINLQLQQRDQEIHKLRAEIASLVTAHDTLKNEHAQSYSALHDEHSQTQAQWSHSTRELEGLRSQHAELSNGMEDIVRQEINSALAVKNAEIQKLQADLNIARASIRDLQAQILDRGRDEVVVVRDEDYFDNACQQLCQHVQQWVLRFSKFSDTRVCRGTSEVRDEKIAERFDNAILDGSDVDNYLSDRIKRRDVFMSVVMTMIWEHVFTRYLFGMERDQRQKLKQLEKQLEEVGPKKIVHQWRALTLTLLSKRMAFRQQCEQDTEAVVIEILKTLSKFLPPPQNLEQQIHESLRKALRAAVELAIEMRTQKAEYIMLPPLQPEYDTNGDLARKVFFNASLMNERSGETTSNDELEGSRAVVRIVLFPLVVKKGDDSGQGEEEIVVCPAQVLVARPDRGKRPKSRLASGGSADNRSLRAASTHSLAMSGVDVTSPGNNMF